MIVNSCQCIDQHQLHVFTVRAQKANLLLCNMLLEAIHVALWAAYSVIMNVHLHPDYVSFQYLIPNKSYNKTCDLENKP